jgi:hypothetical protein
MEQSQKRTTRAVFFAAFLLSGVQLYLADQTQLAMGFGAAALLFLILTWLAR